MFEKMTTMPPLWQRAHIMIHFKYIQIALYGLEGAEDEARQPLQSFVDFINAERKSSDYCGDPCIIDNSNESIPALLHLEGFSVKAGILLLERFLKDGWDLYKVSDHIEYIGMSTHQMAVESMEIMEFRLRRDI